MDINAILNLSWTDIESRTGVSRKRIKTRIANGMLRAKFTRTTITLTKGEYERLRSDLAGNPNHCMPPDRPFGNEICFLSWEDAEQSGVSPKGIRGLARNGHLPGAKIAKTGIRLTQQQWEFCRRVLEHNAPPQNDDGIGLGVNGEVWH